jgi:hypothetical protein
LHRQVELLKNRCSTQLTEPTPEQKQSAETEVAMLAGLTRADIIANASQAMRAQASFDARQVSALLDG